MNESVIKSLSHNICRFSILFYFTYVGEVLSLFELASMFIAPVPKAF